MIDEIKTSLKHGTVLMIASQSELNLFSQLEDAIKEDCLHIDEPYIAFKDGDNAVQMLPLSDVDDSYPNEFKKPRKFMPWYRKALSA